METTPAGVEVADQLLDDTPPPPLGAGALFGLAVGPHGKSLYFVDDVADTLNSSPADLVLLGLSCGRQRPEPRSPRPTQQVVPARGARPR